MADVDAALDALTAELATLRRGGGGSAPVHDPDQPLRALYSRLELLWMDFAARPDVAPVLRARELAERKHEGGAHQHEKAMPTAPSPLPGEGEGEGEEGAQEEEHEMHHMERDAKEIERRLSGAELTLPAALRVEAEIERVSSKCDALRQQLAAPRPRHPRLAALWRLLRALAFFLAWAPILFVLSPLRLLNPTLRRLGIHNNSLPVDVLQQWFACGFLRVCEVRVWVEGAEHMVTSSNVLLAFSHASNLDPMICGCGPLSFKFVGKRVLFRVPVLGWLFHIYGHIGIERSDKASAIRSLDEAVARVRRFRRSVAISPEGTRSRSGRLQPFKKGPFHVAQQVRLPIAPALIIGAYELWPPGALFTAPGDVTIRLLPPLPVPEEADVGWLAARTRRQMLEGLSAPLAPPERRQLFATPAARTMGVWLVPVFYLTLFILLRRATWL